MLFRLTALLALTAFLPAALAIFEWPSWPQPPTRWRTDATYINNATTIAADPHVLYDKKTGLYWAYSTDGADPGWYYGIYTSPDLATWTKVPGGAIKADGDKVWGNDWFWAPECYYNVRPLLSSMSTRKKRVLTRHFPALGEDWLVLLVPRCPLP